MFVLALIVGFSVTIQAGFSRILTNTWGLAGVVAINCLLAAAFAVLYYILVQKNIILAPHFMTNKASYLGMPWWVWIPGLCGFLIVLCMPWAIIKMGATKAIVLAIAAQILSAFLWDIYIEKIPLRSMHIIGAMLTFIGSIFVILA